MCVCVCVQAKAFNVFRHWANGSGEKEVNKKAVVKSFVSNLQRLNRARGEKKGRRGVSHTCN